MAEKFALSLLNKWPDYLLIEAINEENKEKYPYFLETIYQELESRIPNEREYPEPDTTGHL